MRGEGRNCLNRTHIWRSRSSSSKFEQSVLSLSLSLQSVGSERTVLGSFVLHLSLRLSLFPRKRKMQSRVEEYDENIEKPQQMSKPSKILQGMQICSQVKQTGRRSNCRKQQFFSCRKYEFSNFW